MELVLPFATALLFGSLHALEPDHLAAVSSFAVKQPRPRAALLFGVRWAVGHGAVVIVLGTALAVAGAHFPASAGYWLERLVGIGLIALGTWVVLGSRSLHTHTHAHEGGVVHAHLHSHFLRRDHAHRHTVTAVGALHGLAGVAPLMALLPIAGVRSVWGAGVFLVLFAIGTALGMGMYALLAGWIAGRASLRSVGLARLVSAVTGTATIAIGIYWVLA